MRRHLPYTASLLALLAFASVSSRPLAWLGSAASEGITEAQRADYLKRAQVWDQAQYDAVKALTPDAIKAGPTGEDAFALNQAVTCRFIEPTLKNVVGGQTPKFLCSGGTTEAPCPECNVHQKELKVKYGSGPSSNPEIYGEVMGTRLMWLMGFKADRDYPVRVTCLNCPADPWEVYSSFRSQAAGLDPNRPQDVAKVEAIVRNLGGSRATRSFQYAVIEIKLPGDKLKVSGDHCKSPANEATDPQCGGFSWKEIPMIDASAGGATPAQLDAFKLLAAFMTHGDNKPGNQRLECPQENIRDDGTCGVPYVMIQDIGAGFGSTRFFGLGYRKADLGAWASSPLWADRKKCRAKLSSTHELSDPTVSDAGRAFLAKLMDPTVLTDERLTAVFEASRIVEKGDSFNGHPATVADWVATFDKKRADVMQPCGTGGT
jgi:hypothetical protein